MTAISSYVNRLRVRINDISSTLYSDATLTSIIEQSVYALQNTAWYRKFTVVGTEIVRNSDNTISPTLDEDDVILTQAEIMLKYSEVNKSSRESIVVKDIRGTIDVTAMTQQLADAILRLENILSISIRNHNKNKSRGGFGPQTMVFQEYTPSDTINDVTFKTKFNQ
jgi:hypothetical protein